MVLCWAALLDLNVAKVKGSHNAMKSGMLAAEAAFESYEQQQPIQHNWSANVQRY